MREKVKMKTVVVLLLLFRFGVFAGAGAFDVTPETLFFQYENDGVLSLRLPPSTSPSPTTVTPTPITSTRVPAEWCYNETSSSTTANIVDFDYDPHLRRLVFISWNERVYASKAADDELLLWYDYYDYVQFSGRRLAVDHRNGKFYTIDRFVNPTLEVVDFEGKHRSVLIVFEAIRESKEFLFEGRMPEELETAVYPWLVVHEYPVDVVLDVEEGVMFVRTNVSTHSRIHRANMDGTDLRLLIADAGDIGEDSFGLAIDRVNKRIYWYDVDQELVESIDYEGSNRVRVMRLEGLVAMAVHAGRLLWSQSSTNAANGGRIYSCALLKNLTCEPPLARTILLTNSSSVPYKLLVPPPQASATNPCAANNGGCQHLCLLRGKDSHGCACKIGHRLAANGRDCQPVLELLVYEANNYLRGQPLDGAAAPTAGFPLQYVWGVIERSQVAGMEYNKATGMMLYMECRNMVQLDLDAAMRGCWSFERNTSDCYKHMAYDWKAGKVYITKQQGKDGKYVLGVVDVPPTFKRRATVTPAVLRVISQPLSLVVQPSTGYVYLLAHNASSDRSTITRLTVGGYNATVLEISGAERARGLALDQEKSRLYWFSDDSPEIKHAALDGSDVQTLAGVVPVQRPEVMIVEDDWVYVKNATSVWRVKKITGSSIACVVPERPNTKLRSSIRVMKRRSEQLHYGDEYQITKAACKIFCAYVDEKESVSEADVELCRTLLQRDCGQSDDESA